MKNLSELEKRFCKKIMARSNPSSLKKSSYTKKFHIQNQDRHNAWKIMNESIRRGIISRMPCEVCGEIKAEGHHSDYSKPLDITWLCRKHHLAAHGKKALDYSLIPEDRRKELESTLAALGFIKKEGKAGRPTLSIGEKKKLIIFCAHPRLLDWMNTRDETRTKLVEMAMADIYNLCPQCWLPLHRFHNCQISPVSEPGKPEGENK